MRRQRPPLRAPEAIEAILERAGESRFARQSSPVSRNLWREAVGARIAERAHPVSISDGLLLLRVPSSTWAHELSLLAEVVCGRLRERGVDVRDLRFRVGALPNVERPPERRLARSVPVRTALPSELASTLRDVDDEGLRATIASAAAANLAWQTVLHAAKEQLNEGQRGVRAPRFSEGEIAPQARASGASPEADSGTPANERDRRR
jgi:hypothetical protein